MPGLLRDLVGLYHHIQDPNQQMRQNLQLALQQNPDLAQKLTDSNLANDPNQLAQALGLSNARWGANSNAGTQIAQTLSNSPLSETEKLKRMDDLKDVNPNDIANSGVNNIPALRAFNGMTNQQFQQVAPQVQNAIKQPDNQIASTSMLSPDQQDQLAKARGLPTSLDKSKATADIDLLNAERTSALANAYATKSRARKEEADAQTAERSNQTQKEANDLLDQAYQNNPRLKARPLLDIYNDPTISQEVKNAMVISNKTGDAFTKELGAWAENQRLKLEARGQNITQEDARLQREQLPKIHAYEQFARDGGQGDLQGYLDYFSGQQTPAAQAAVEVMHTGTPQVKQASANAYNAAFQKLQTAINSKNPPDWQTINTMVDNLNSQVPNLVARGIPAQVIKYDFTPDSKLTSGARIMNHIYTEAGKPKSLQPVDGNGVVGPVTYTPTKDPSHPDNKSSDDPVTLQKKGELYQKIKTENPLLSPSIIRSRVEAAFAKPSP